MSNFDERFNQYCDSPSHSRTSFTFTVWLSAHGITKVPLRKRMWWRLVRTIRRERERY